MKVYHPYAGADDAGAMMEDASPDARAMTGTDAITGTETHNPKVNRKPKDSHYETLKQKPKDETNTAPFGHSFSCHLL
jgi:hypothetical protein